MDYYQIILNNIYHTGQQDSSYMPGYYPPSPRKTEFPQKAASGASMGETQFTNSLIRILIPGLLWWVHSTAHQCTLCICAGLGRFSPTSSCIKAVTQTIVNYRSALSQVIPTARNHEAITRLLKSFLLEAPITRNCVTVWDLSVVLSRLWGFPFETLKWEDSNSRMLCTKKTLFLPCLGFR